MTPQRATGRRLPNGAVVVWLLGAFAVSLLVWRALRSGATVEIWIIAAIVVVGIIVAFAWPMLRKARVLTARVREETQAPIVLGMAMPPVLALAKERGWTGTGQARLTPVAWVLHPDRIDVWVGKSRAFSVLRTEVDRVLTWRTAGPDGQDAVGAVLRSGDTMSMEFGPWLASQRRRGRADGVVATRATTALDVLADYPRA